LRQRIRCILTDAIQSIDQNGFRVECYLRHLRTFLAVIGREKSPATHATGQAGCLPETTTAGSGTKSLLDSGSSSFGDVRGESGNGVDETIEFGDQLAESSVLAVHFFE